MCQQHRTKRKCSRFQTREQYYPPRKRTDANEMTDHWKFGHPSDLDPDYLAVSHVLTLRPTLAR